MTLYSIAAHHFLAHAALVRFVAIAIHGLLDSLLSSHATRSCRYGRITSRLLVEAYRFHFFVTHVDAYTLMVEIK